ncbi:LamG domain-containing protein [Stygiolobus caldivivus]|uniref:LamG-like jellyroll fold domain-containing protein n=1 Tax=Stygiolobus caldivivus TaxID=2824673 RepID=A0A8D5U527_9CREN|nr:LamG domain-containing protein [Stygiolobus caldivivus]BCU69640.1 hypothetical protein KN1_09370 [Stygiolobus caldivivus]
MVRINRRKFIITSSIAAGALISTPFIIKEIETPNNTPTNNIVKTQNSIFSPSSSSASPSSTSSSSSNESLPIPPYEAIVYGTPNSGYKVITSSGVIFNGSCSDGSGTCGIFEAINYLKQNSGGFGAVRLLGQFYPVNSPTVNTQGITIMGDNAQIFINPASAPAFIQLLPQMENVKVLWYSNLGVVNTILNYRPSFSLQPYVLFTSTSQALFFENGDLSLGSPSQFTISFWAYANSGGYAGTLLSYGSTQKGAAWVIKSYQNNVYFLGSSGSISGSAVQNKEYHIAVTYDNGNATLYINGNEVASGTVTINYPSLAYLWLWNFPIYSQQGGPNPPSWYGYIENVQFYNEVLSHSQITALASSPTQDPVSTSVSFWALYRYLMFIGDLISGKGFQRMGALLLSGVF